MADIRQINLIDLVPDSIKSDPQVQAAAAAINSELQAVTAAIPVTMLIARLDELPEAVIDLLAWQWHVDYYEPVGLDVDTKRKLVRQSIAWHRRKGTPGVVQEVVTTVLGDAKVLEWFNYGGEPYWFKVECNDIVQDGQTLTRLGNLINSVKNTRSWCEGLKIKREYPNNIYFAGPIHKSKQTTFHIAPYKDLQPKQSLFIARPIHSIKRTTIYPQEVM